MKLKLLIILFILITCIACDDFFEKDISSELPTLTSPTQGMETTDTIILFNWLEIEDADFYNLQIVSPKFNTAHKLMIDTVTELTNLNLVLPYNDYQWRVKASNHSSQTSFSVDSFKLIEPFDVHKVLIELNFPEYGYISDKSLMKFEWMMNENVTFFDFVVKEDSWTDSIVYEQTTNQNSIEISLKDGNYFWGIAAIENKGEDKIRSEYNIRSLIVNSEAPDYPSIIKPTIKDTIKGYVVEFSWTTVEDSASYNLQLFKDIGLRNLLIDTWVDDTATIVNVPYDGKVFGRLKTKDRYGKTGSFSPTFSFLIETEQDISGTAIKLVAPPIGEVILDTAFTFFWDIVEGATKYNIMVVTPGFNNIQKIMYNAWVEENSMEAKLPPGQYEWRVKAANDEFETNYRNSYFTIYESQIADKTVNLSSPENNALFGKATVDFRWETVYPGCLYRFIIKAGDWESGTFLKEYETRQIGFQMNLGHGDYSWGVQAIDPNNNVATDFTTRTFELDLIAPDTPKPTSPVDQFETFESQIEFVWEANEDDGLRFHLQVFKSSTTFLEIIYENDTNQNSYKLNLENTGRYSWRVKAIDKAGNESGYSTFMNLLRLSETDISYAIVKLLSPIDYVKLSKKEHSLWWEELDGATEYQLEIVKPSFNNIQDLVLKTTLAETNYNITLDEGQYEWRVKAKNTSSQTAYSYGNFIIEDADISNEYIKLATPENGFLTKNESIDFKWESVKGNSTYIFQLKRDNWDGGNLLERITTKDTTLNLSLSDGEYFWGVQAIGIDNSSTEYSTRSFTIDTEPPGIPALISPDNDYETYEKRIIFNWEIDNEPSCTYEFELYKVREYDEILVFKEQTDQKNISYDFGFSSGTYFWKVRATDIAGNIGSYSISNRIYIQNEIDLTLEKVNLLSPADSVHTGLKLVPFWWEKVEGATSYTFELIRPNFDSPEELITEEDITNNKISIQLNTLGQYQWRVKANNIKSKTSYSTRSLFLE